MKRSLWLGLVLFFVLSSMVFTLSCAKKAVQSDPSVQTEQAAEETVDQKAEGTDQQALEEQRLEDERLAAEQAQMKAEQDAMAAKELFQSEDIYFDFDSAVIVPKVQDILQVKAAWMAANINAKVTVEGHCDERGTEAYNLSLGERRAEAAKNYLIDLGIDPARLAIISYGEERPVDPGQTESAWAKNRRAHFAID